MAHNQQHKFIETLASNLNGYFCDAKVLEVGSLNINGTIRGFFHNCEYVGLDVAEGRDVDVVCQGQDYDAPDDSFDHVISCEAMEHNPFWVETFLNMVRVCKPGGLVVMTCANTGRPEHGTSRTSSKLSPLTVGLGWDYYHNLNKDNFNRKIELERLFFSHRFWNNWRAFDLYFCGIKRADVILNKTQHGFERAVARIDMYVNELNSIGICSYRASMAKLFGDRYFFLARKFINILRYVHSWVED